MTSDAYLAVDDAFRNNAVGTADDETLQAWLIVLANESIANPTIHQAAVIRGLTLNHILLERHLSALDRKNTITQYLVIGLTVAALIATGVQTWIAVRAERRASALTTPATPTLVAPVVRRVPAPPASGTAARLPLENSSPPVVDSSTLRNPKDARRTSPRTK